MNQHSTYITCLFLGFLINNGGLKCNEIHCGQNTLLCSCNGPLGNKQIAINVEYCLAKTNTCEPCDLITDTVKCKAYENYCNQKNNRISASCLCQNGGTCVNGSAGTCICLEKFEGKLCELQGELKPTSEKYCEIPENPNAGYIAYESKPMIPGEYIRYICNTGYELYGNVTRYCQDSGKLGGVAPTCVKICRIPDMTYNRLNYVINPNHQEGTELVDRFGNVMITDIQFSCQDNFTLKGHTLIRCSNGIWDNKPPSCIWYGPSCKVPVIKPQMIQLGTLIKGGFVLPESIFQYMCKNGTVMLGDSMIVCTYNGSWVPKPPKCLLATGFFKSLDSAPLSCSAPKTPENGYLRFTIDLNAAVPGIKNDNSILPVQTQVMYNCREGYRLTTSEAFRTCLPDGKWNGKDPACIPECGKPNSPIPTYILNGTAITINKWPWHVGLYTYDDYTVFCGGSVLNEKWVLTAAHCVTEKLDGGDIKQVDYETYGVFFGHSTSQVNVSSRETIIKRKVWSVIHHQDYNPFKLDSDIALVLLKTPLTFSNEIRPVCLPTFKSSATDILNSAGFVAGWGETNPNITTISLELRYIQVKIVTNEMCEDSNVDGNGFHVMHITQNMFCAAGNKNGSGPCHGDSGGSLCVKTGPKDNEVFQIEGIVSFGGFKGCGATGQYNGFTKVRSFVDWIQSYINQ